MILLPSEIILKISSYLSKQNRKKMLLINKDFYNIIIFEINRRKEIKIDIYIPSSNFVGDYFDLKDYIYHIESYQNYNIFKILDNIFSNSKLSINHLRGIIIWFKLFKRELVTKSYIYEKISNIKIYQWIISDLSNFIDYVRDEKNLLVKTRDEKVNKILNKFKDVY
mgnify:CR=1 FL=1|tara:strand:- start:58 stop:558 length:501 start_codon:yes stop_codon:yes gene_type:complete